MVTQKVIWINRSLKSDKLRGWKVERERRKMEVKKWKEIGSEYININIDTVKSTKNN